jgi:MFS family permease
LGDVAVVEFANGLAFAAFVPFLALWLTGPVGMSPLLAGIAGFGVYSLTAMAGGLYGGAISDRVGRRPVMVAGLAAGTLRLALLAVTTDEVLVAALIAFGGFVDSVVPPATAGLVADRVPKRQLNEGYGFVRAARTVALGVGPVLGAALATVSFEAVFVAAAACRGTALLAALLVREPRRRIGRAAQPLPRLSTLRDRPFMRVLEGTAVLALFYGWFDTVVAVHLRDRGFAISTWGAIYAGGAIFTSLLALNIARRIDRGRRFQRWVGVGAAAYALGFLLLLPAWLPAVIGGVALVGLAQIVLNPLESSLTARLAPDGRTGAYQGALSVVHAAAFATGPVFGLGLYQATSAQFTFLVAVAVLPVGAALVMAAISSAAARGRLRLTKRVRPKKVHSMAGVPYVVIERRVQCQRVIDDTEKELRRIDRRIRKVTEDTPRIRFGLGWLLVPAGVLGIVAATVHQSRIYDGGEPFAPGVFVAVITAGLLLVLIGSAYEWFAAQTRGRQLELLLGELRKSESEARRRLADARDQVDELLNQALAEAKDP